eukprot:CAMPEP_0201477660 /NCGR_PEP_ID=MMETSP0151_2-20130828/2639_1 /ASSEMBLY_ACC=CAM_ASM_000257 /TAXON_ID=200890 /ORGANISM="Paramoeba atlantica, Strain 621/1 / CCAP 1560/9" /LENGTH=72 /DNA_ID=CAMNT_0047858455 /DNA_START=15 /DNA_END=229 /DNA_ORIENTATION=-
MAAASEEGEILIDLREFLKDGDESTEILQTEEVKKSFQLQLQDPSQIIEGIQFSDRHIGIKREGFHCLLDCL